LIFIFYQKERWKANADRYREPKRATTDNQERKGGFGRGTNKYSGFSIECYREPSERYDREEGGQTMRIRGIEVDFRVVLDSTEYSEWQRKEAMREEDCFTDAWIDEMMIGEIERRKKNG
jgi:hypothetical protein